MRDIELNPGVLTEVNVTVQADILLRTPEEGVSSCEKFSLTKCFIYYSASVEWWCYSEFVTASLSPTRPVLDLVPRYHCTCHCLTYVKVQ